VFDPMKLAENILFYHPLGGKSEKIFKRRGGAPRPYKTPANQPFRFDFSIRNFLVTP
jgi:hypothetical protein